MVFCILDKCEWIMRKQEMNEPIFITKRSLGHINENKYQ